MQNSIIIITFQNTEQHRASELLMENDIKGHPKGRPSAYPTAGNRVHHVVSLTKIAVGPETTLESLGFRVR